ncbi:hypothetical protein GCM10010381_25320 [Streptomyces xantholiticus]|nr:hypothetical protein GCM10010381_25320 [Streptomyces xantholiticus]
MEQYLEMPYRIRRRPDSPEAPQRAHLNRGLHHANQLASSLVSGFALCHPAVLGTMTPVNDADPGLFGPDSVTWNVHADPVMWIAGVRALYLQALHPRAVRGVMQNRTSARTPGAG